MDFRESEFDGVHVLIPIGRIDSTCSEELQDRVASMVMDGRHHIVIDMSEVDFIDSSGLGTLVKGLRTTTHAGGTLKIAGLDTQLQHLFELTRLDRLFDLFPDVDRARRSFQSS